MVGSVWRAKAPSGDLTDELVVRGQFEGEVVLAPTAFGPVFTCIYESLVNSYVRVSPGEAAADADWSTSPEDVARA
jgi:hypothetical protein